MQGSFATFTLAAILLAAGLVDHVLGHHHEHHHDNDHDHSNDGDMKCHKLSSPNAFFGFDLYKKIKATADARKNIFYSPLGISTALSMLSTGAKGETHSEIFSSLGYSSFDQIQINEAYKTLFHKLSHSKDQLDIGNAVAVGSGVSAMEKFQKDVKEFYTGDIINVNFNKPQEAAAEINSYIASKTQNKIKDQVKDLDPDMAMVLVNYISFRGRFHTHRKLKNGTQITINCFN